MAYETDETPKAREGGQDKVWVTNKETTNLLHDILEELQIMNLHLAIITNNEIKKRDIND
jgi:hypothetical protein